MGGSMVLAGLLLKIRGYGIIRIMILLKMSELGFVFYLMITLGLVGGLFAILVCMRQLDLKSFIAYSSVSHISLSLGGLLIRSILGFQRSFFMFLGHRIVSPLMFYFGNLMYERVGTRIYMRLRGVLKSFKIVGFLIFLVLLFNIGFPPLLNFVREVFIYFSVLKFNVLFRLSLRLLMVCTRVVIVKFFSKIFRSRGIQVIVRELSNREFILRVLGFMLFFWMSRLIFLL